MPNKKLRCSGCKEYFERETLVKIKGSNFHSFDCAAAHALKLSQKKKESKAKQELKAKKESARPRSWYVKDAQKWFNKFIRLRDKDLPCICCDRPHDNSIQWHAGHFLTTAARPEHRFNEDNCHKQTSYCNNYLSGNVAEYRKRLILKIGPERVCNLERDHSAKKYSIDDLKSLIATYKNKCKKLEGVNS